MVTTATAAQSIARAYFSDIIQTHISSCDSLEKPLEKGSSLISQALLAGNKVITYGTIDTAHLANYFASQLLQQFEVERPSLPAIALNQQANSPQQALNALRSLSKSGDVLVLLLPNLGQVTELLLAVKNLGLKLVILCGQATQNPESLAKDQDCTIMAPSKRLPVILNCFQTMLSCLCLQIDANIFGYGGQ